MLTWVFSLTAAAQTITLTGSDGSLAPGAVDGGAVEIVEGTYLPLAFIGCWLGTLAHPAAIDGVRCAGAVRFTGGHLTHCVLDGPLQSGPLHLPSGSRIERIPAQSPQSVFRAQVPGGLVLGGRRYPAGEEQVFHPDGSVWYRIQSASSAAPDVSLPCRWGREADKVLLHADGALAQCILAREARVGPHTLPADTIVALGPRGRVLRADLGGEWNGHGADGRIFFAPDGSVSEVRSRHIIDAPNHPLWAVGLGFYYDYPWADSTSQP